MYSRTRLDRSPIDCTLTLVVNTMIQLLVASARLYLTRPPPTPSLSTPYLPTPSYLPILLDVVQHQRDVLLVQHFPLLRKSRTAVSHVVPLFAEVSL